jgi:hypothetical protein
VEGEGIVRTIVFEADHRSEISVLVGPDGHIDVRFHTASGGATNIETSQNVNEEPTNRTRDAEPALFRHLQRGPLRVVYNLPGEGAVKRYQTEWILIP